MGSIAALVAIYYLLPLDRSSTWVAARCWSSGCWCLSEWSCFRSAGSSGHGSPACGVEALATSIPLFLLLFASTYVVIATISAGNFSELLTRTGAQYFTVTVFSTVGFGGITAKTDTARLVVTGQMILDLVIGLAVKVIVGAANQGCQRQPVDD